MRFKFIHTIIIICLALLNCTETEQKPPLEEGFSGNAEKMIAGLGCGSCHGDLNITSDLRERLPDLSSAGLRYNPAYLFDYLQNPVKIRRHIGLARMPNFRFSEEEALALTLFLEKQQRLSGEWPEFPPGIEKSDSQNAGNISKEQFYTVIRDSLVCLTCHTLEGEGGNLAAELSELSFRLNPGWLKRFLAFPARFGVPVSTMPPQFFQLSNDQTHFREMTPRAAEKIQQITQFLFTLNSDRREALDKKYAGAKSFYPRATADLGEKIFRSQNCAACHFHDAIKPNPAAAPNLSMEGIRVNEAWLVDFLKHPYAIRPSGYRPGSGSRMPDFNLSDREAQVLSQYLLEQKEGADRLDDAFTPGELSAFSLKKARRLLYEKLSCLGCHRLGGNGGKIAPDLSNAGNRLQPAFIYRVIKNPQEILPHSIMPQIPLAPATLNLIANFLAQQKTRNTDPSYLSLTENSLIFLEEENFPGNQSHPAKTAYLKYCAACHGRRGEGDGFNTRFLPAKPTIHADKQYMSKRPDDALFDGVYTGGYMLNKSQFMPPWGQTLSRSEIKNLVTYLRDLCQCQGPAWSLDNR
jgi:mono/diheme cytochrome c family protein